MKDNKLVKEIEVLEEHNKSLLLAVTALSWLLDASEEFNIEKNLSEGYNRNTWRDYVRYSRVIIDELERRKIWAKEYPQSE